MTRPAAAPPAVHAERPPTSPWVVLVLVCLAQFMVVLDATIVNVALPSIQRDLNFAPADLQWVINGYTLLFGGFLLLGGRAGDLLGRKRLFLAGLAVFTFASLLNGLANSSELLIAARALQGLGAALVSPAALSIITTTFADGAERTKALGIWGAIAGVGGAVGLLLGGILTELLSWEWIFFVNIPVGIAAFVLSARLVPESRVTHGVRSFDLLGALTVTSGLIVLTYAIVKGQEFGWTSGRTLGLAAVAVALLVAFVIIEGRSAAPLVRLNIFRLRSLATANAVFLLVAGALFSMFFFASLYVQVVLGYSPIEAGLAFLPVTAGIISGSVVAQLLIKRLGVKPVAVFGMAVATIGLLVLSGVTADGTYAGGLLPGLLIMSLGMGSTFVPVTLIATTNVANDDAGLASGLFNTSQQIGGALGLAILSTLSSDRAAEFLAGLGRRPSRGDQNVALVEGFQNAFTVGAGMMFLGVLLLLFMLRTRDVANITAEAAVPAPAA